MCDLNWGPHNVAVVESAADGFTYSVGARAANDCVAPSSKVTDILECERAAAALGQSWAGAGQWRSSPGGCLTSIWDGRGVFFNNRHGGTAHPDQAPVCRSAQEACRAQQAVQHEQAQVVSGWHVSTQSQSCDACCTAAGGSCVAESWPPELDEAAFAAALSSAASVEGLSN
eukprot:COSAG04_NODE_8793_length_931_cov_1.018029_2_plen_171_part_01